jgi:4-alpha-glucanotransferase
MSDQRLAELATAAGLAVDWVDADNRPQRVSPEVLRRILGALECPAQTPQQIEDSLARLAQTEDERELPALLTLDYGQPLDLSRHFAPGTNCQLQLEDGNRLDIRLDDQGRLPAIANLGYQQLQIGDRLLHLAVAPERCTGIEELCQRPPRAWGLAVQMYALRRPGDGGLGDTQALESLVHAAAAHGADAIAISPLHAMYSAETRHYSPYSPSSRLFYNILHAAPGSILGERELRQAIASCGLDGELQRLESLELVDWPAAAQARLCVLRALFGEFRRGGNPLWEDFSSFRRTAGEALENHCRFEAIQAFQVSQGEARDWRHWPESLRDPGSPAVARFAAEHAEEVSFHAFAQWLIARGLERTQIAARSCGMGIGLISDLAVGADGGGSQAWSRQAELLSTLTVGAPPDILNRSGQAWGISAFSPCGLKRHGFRAFIEMLRANFAHAGGMCIDHVMGLKRLWVMPEGADPREGAYLNYPFDDLLRLLALESWRHQALVLGEDLGTVPAGFREQMAARGILGMRVLLFEQDAQANFHPAHTWPGDALATSSTHDLPTLAGWWLERDIDWRAKLGEYDAEAEMQARRARERERQGLRVALGRDDPHLVDQQLDVQDMLDGCAAFLGHTPAPLVLLPMEDALGLVEQANLPGIVERHPNWQRRWPGTSSELLERADADKRLRILAEARRQARGTA